ncbi:hypothetical protein E2F47_23485, partial [Mycobacterium eburneum]
MTYPVTPNPAIHQEPASVQKYNNQQLLNQLRTTFSQLPAQILKMVINAILNALLGTSGVDYVSEAQGDLQALASQIETALQNIPQEAVKGLESALSTVETNAQSALTQIEDILTNAGQETASALGSFISGLLGPNSALNANNIIGQLFPSQIGPVSISSLANITPQLLATTDFSSADEVDGGGIWSVANGAVTATANGSQIQLFSPGSIPVSPGQVYNVSATALWSGVRGGTDALSLMVAPYSGTTPGTLASIAQVDNPAASSTGTALSGTYTVPASGVDSIRLVFSINPSATAGSVSFKAPSAQ